MVLKIQGGKTDCEFLQRTEKKVLKPNPEMNIILTSVQGPLR